MLRNWVFLKQVTCVRQLGGDINIMCLFSFVFFSFFCLLTEHAWMSLKNLRTHLGG